MRVLLVFAERRGLPTPHDAPRTTKTTQPTTSSECPSRQDQLLADYGVEYDRVWVKLGTRIEARWKGKWYSGTIAGSMEMKQRQNRRPQKRVLCFEIAWTDPEDFGKKNWVDRDDVRTVA